MRFSSLLWLARLDSDVGQLQYKVERLQSDVGGLQADVEELQAQVERLREGQRHIIEILQRLESDVPEIRGNLIGHTHDSSGQAQLLLDRQ